MKDNKFADLDREQLEEINELEDRLGITLVAYEISTTFDSTSSEISST
ncbi:hypothetical protein [Psychrobacillus lasiicapitis]|nr:hypothetical protein [Psychrobacillus lasiicapitis]GGA40503.1 hypothetical protein GCM10011384_32670 [Psychrobacillus lasiicapitis]